MIKNNTYVQGDAGKQVVDHVEQAIGRLFTQVSHQGVTDRIPVGVSVVGNEFAQGRIHPILANIILQGEIRERRLAVVDIPLSIVYTLTEFFP
ncbi:hypothetical protein [Parapedobacter sp. 2B3]|uniref:hypothetical protein n=1 Tax=Parapedobacter sp. 2B3 TaxID=3342381 RepID=UPI0035B6476C